MKKNLKLYFILMILSVGAANLWAKDWNKEYRAIMGSIPIIFSDDGICSGALIDQKHILTAYHCISSIREVKIIWPEQINNFDQADVVGVDPINDLAILRLRGQGHYNPILILDSAQDVGTGIEVFTIGHPSNVTSFGRFPVDRANTHLISSGIISKVNGDELIYDFSVSPGNSGGPVVNAEGKIIGVVSRKQAGMLIGNIGYAPGHRLINDLYEQVLADKSKLGWQAAKPFSFDYGLTYSRHDYLTKLGSDTPERILLDLSVSFFDRINVAYGSTLFLKDYQLRFWSFGYKFHMTFNNLSTLTLIPTVDIVDYFQGSSDPHHGVGGGLLLKYSVLPVGLKYTAYEVENKIFNAFSVYLMGSF